MSAPSIKQNIVVSRVVINEDELIPPTRLYPNHHVCNIHPSNQERMKQAAQDVGTEITFGAPRDAKFAGTVGVYVANYDVDPKLLIQRFRVLQVWNMERHA